MPSTPSTIVRVALLSILISGCKTEEPQPRPSSLEVSEVLLEPDANPVPLETEVVANAEPAHAGVVELEPSEDTGFLVGPDLSQPHTTIEVRPGESLVLLADFADLIAEDIADFNQIDVRRVLQVGDELLVPLAEEQQADFHTMRDAWFKGKVERYMAKRGGLVGVRVHRVGTGETGWSIAQDVAGVPLWVLAYYNEGVELGRLSIGDELAVPMLGDTVAHADEPAEQ